MGNVGGFLYSSLNRIVLTGYLGSNSLPYYALPLSIVTQLHGAIAAQIYALFPMLAQAGARARDVAAGMEDRLRWLVGAASMFLYVGLGMIGPTVLAWLVSLDFAEHARWPLYLSCVAYFFVAQVLVYHYALWAVGKAAPNVVPDFAASLLTVLTAFVLIPRFGYVGASVALLWRLPAVAVQVVWARRALSLRTGMKGLFAPYASMTMAFVLGWSYSAF